MTYPEGKSPQSQIMSPAKLWILIGVLCSVGTIQGAPKPHISGITPTSVIAGDSGFKLLVLGDRFNSSSRVRWNGAGRTTRALSGERLEADIPASDITAAGTADISVTNQDGEDDIEVSNKVSFTINNPVPAISSISPASVTAGSTDFTLTVNGSGFLTQSTIRFGNSNRNVTLVSRSQLRTIIQASDVMQPGTASIRVVNPGPGGGTSNALTLTISVPAPTITTASPLPQGTVAIAYSQSLAASGGTPPYSWSIGSGSLPEGLRLNASNGSISGTPSTSGSSTFDVRVSDSASTSSTKQFQLLIAVNATPAFTIVGPSDSIEPAQQPSIEITLTSTLPSPISGQLALNLRPNADVASDDPSIQFSTGGRTINFSIPANASRAIFSNGAPNIAFQTGTIAGQIELTASGRSGGSSPTPLPASTRILTLSRRSPAITRLSIASRSPSGFELAITGFSTPRSLTQATFRFTAAQGASLETSTVNLSLAIAAATWFQSQTAATLGGQFRLRVPFTIQGEMTAIQSVSVTLSNGEGTSTVSSVQF